MVIVLIFATVFVSVSAVRSLFGIITSSAPDFSVFYESAVNLVKGESLYTDPSLFTGLGYPPVSLVPFLGFTLLPYPTAQAMWIFSSFVLFLGSIWLSLRLFARPSWENILIGFIAGFLAFPTRFTLGMGQVNFVALFFLLVALLFLQKGRRVTAGALLALALLYKPHLALFFPVLLLWKQWKVVVGALFCFTLATLVVGIVFGWDQWLSYATIMLPQLAPFHGREIYYNQGVSAFASRVFASDMVAGFSAAALSILLYAAALYRVKKSGWKPVESVIRFLPVFLLVEPLSWQHHGVFLIPTFVLLWMRANGKLRHRVLLVASYVLVAYNIRRPELFGSWLDGITVLSHGFWGYILLTALSLGLV